MLAKKNQKFDFRKNSTLFFSLGLLCMSILAYFAIELQIEKEFTSELLGNQETIKIEEPVFSYVPKTQEYTSIKKVQFVEKFIITKADPITDVTTKDPMPYDPNAKPNTPTEPERPNTFPVFIEPVDNEIKTFIDISETPVFPGCENLSKEERDQCFREKVLKHIHKNLRYPENALENEHQGKVHVQFIIEKDGSISIANLRGPYESLNKEAMRVIKSLPKIKPGEQRNRIVKVSYMVPIIFKAN
jgi:protein TonB